MNPVVALVVTNAAVERMARKNDDKTAALSDALQKVLVELPNWKFFNVDKYGVSQNLKIYFDQAANRNKMQDINKQMR